jgi:hypothetical protein
VAVSHSQLAVRANTRTHHRCRLRCVTAGVSSSLLPIRSVANMGAGAADLLLVPLGHYQSQRSVATGVVKGVSFFARAVALESLRFAADLAVNAQVCVVEHCCRVSFCLCYCRFDCYDCCHCRCA